MAAGKTLLIISGGLEAADVATRAKEMGLGVVMSDADPQAPGFAFADSCLIADAHGPAETAAAAERYSRKIRKIDGVIAIAVQAPLTVATVAQRLGLPGLPLHVAELAQDRLAVKKTFLSAGIASPWFAEIRTPQELQRAVIAHGRELLLWPVEGRDNAGAERLAGIEDLNAAFLRTRSHSPSDREAVEKSPSGTVLIAETMVMAGRCFTPLIGEEDEPGRQPSALLEEIRQLIARAAGALGISDGTLAAEITLQDGQPQLTDISACLSGFFCTRQIARHTGVDFIGAAIRLALGESVSESELTPH